MKKLVFLKILLTGLFAGIFSGLLGIGGGLVAIPLLTTLWGLSQRQAHGTSLMTIIFSGAAGAFAYYTHGNIDYQAALIIAVSAMGAACMGAKYCDSLPEWKLKKLFGFFLLISVLLLLSKPHLSMITDNISYYTKLTALLGIGLIGGFLSGLLGVGSGGIMIAGMVIFLGMSQVTAQGTALLVMVPTGSVGAYTHWQAGNVVIKVLPALVMGVFVGSYLGAFFAHAITETTLVLLFSTTLTIMATRYLAARPPKEANNNRENKY